MKILIKDLDLSIINLDFIDFSLILRYNKNTKQPDRFKNYE